MTSIYAGLNKEKSGILAMKRRQGKGFVQQSFMKKYRDVHAHAVELNSIFKNAL